jgi:hypothetical protein
MEVGLLRGLAVGFRHRDDGTAGHRISTGSERPRQQEISSSAVSMGLSPRRLHI